jgi:S-adenosylmethionine decarboxylase
VTEGGAIDGTVSLGTHLILELYGCETSRLEDSPQLTSDLERVATEAGAHVINRVSHGFEPTGVSAVLLLAESHLTVHTWPEHAYVAVDVFTCGHPDLHAAIREGLIDYFRAARCESQLLSRGTALLPARHPAE